MQKQMENVYQLLHCLEEEDCPSGDAAAPRARRQGEKYQITGRAASGERGLLQGRKLLERRLRRGDNFPMPALVRPDAADDAGSLQALQRLVHAIARDARFFLHHRDRRSRRFRDDIDHDPVRLFQWTFQ